MKLFFINQCERIANRINTTKVTFICIVVATLAIILSLVYQLYQDHYPIEVAKFKALTIQEQSVEAGDIFHYSVELTKYLPVAARVTRKLYSVDDKEGKHPIEITPDITGSTETGPLEFIRICETPFYTPAGQYYLRVFFKYPLPPHKEKTYILDSSNTIYISNKGGKAK